MNVPRRIPARSLLAPWLTIEGSLTWQLRKYGVVDVKVQYQGQRPLWNDEQQELNCRNGYVREVILSVNGTPAVWARSAVQPQAIQGAWRELHRLGERPLAEILFSDRQTKRLPLQTHFLKSSTPAQSRMRKQWAAAQNSEDKGLPQWARSSVFLRNGHPLRVMEAFSPWLQTLPVRRYPG